MANKYDAYGSILKRGATTIAGVRTISGPSLSLDTVDVTTHDSPNAWREFIATLIDAGEVTLDIVWDPDDTTQISLRTDLIARTAVGYSVTMPDATPQVWSFSGFVTAYQPNAPVDGELSASVTIKITGAVTIA